MESPSVDSIGLNCFLQCVKLTRVTLPSSLTYVGDNGFRDSYLSGTLIMPSALAHIGQYAFNHQDIDTLIFMPSEGACLGDYSFANCPNLVSITMYSPSVDTFGSRCFSDCPNLRNVVLPSSLSSIQYGAFGWCNQLQCFRINSLIPPVIPAGTEVFPYWSGGVIDLYVPAGTKEAYQVAVFWNRFNIIEYDLHLSVNRDKIQTADTAGTYGLEITSSVNWQVNTDQQWLTADPAIGMDTAGIALIVEANPDTAIREAIVTLSGLNVPSKTLVVIQDPLPALSLSDLQMEIGWLEGSTAKFNIVSNQEWTVQSNVSWLETSSLSGSRSREIVLTAVANPDTMTREATITVYSPRLTPQTLIVTQAPAKVLAVSPAELIIGSEEGSIARFNISSNTDWTVQSSQPWLELSSVNGKGNMEIMLTAESNPEFTEREALISISADEVPLQSITLTQEAAVPTGLDAAASEVIEIYPNPVRSALHIDHAGGGEMLVRWMQAEESFIRINSQAIMKPLICHFFPRANTS
jgi:hypothetical protein